MLTRGLTRPLRFFHSRVYAATTAAAARRGHCKARGALTAALPHTRPARSAVLARSCNSPPQRTATVPPLAFRTTHQPLRNCGRARLPRCAAYLLPGKRGPARCATRRTLFFRSVPRNRPPTPPQRSTARAAASRGGAARLCLTASGSPGHGGLAPAARASQRPQQPRSAPHRTHLPGHSTRRHYTPGHKARAPGSLAAVRWRAPN
jgi:hypothetical protein